MDSGDDALGARAALLGYEGDEAMSPERMTESTARKETVPQSRAGTTGRGDLDALTGLRFLAASAVLLFHFGKLEWWAPQAPASLMHLVNAGEHAVSLFFMLSGFILQNAYPAMRADRHERRRFWIARFARIYPVYLLGFLWFTPFALNHWFATETPRIAATKAVSCGLAGLLLLQNWFLLRLGLVWNTPGWTLSMEAMFYLAFPWLSRWVRSLPRSRLLPLCLGCMALSTVLAAVAMRYLPGKTDVTLLLARHPLMHFPTFLCGLGLGRLYQTRSVRSRVHADALTLGGIAWILLTASGLWPVEQWSPGFSGYLPGMAALLYGLATGGVPGRWLATRPMLLLGEASYALYILQFPVSYTLQAIFANARGSGHLNPMQEGPMVPLWPYQVLLLPVLLAVAIAVFTYIETPCRVWLRSTLAERFGERPLPPPEIPVMLT